MSEFDWQLEKNKIISTQRKLTFAIALIMLVLILQLFGWKNFFSGKGAMEPHYIAEIAVGENLDTDQEKFAILESIADDEAVKAVIFTINSPGGGVYPSERYYNIIREISNKKPTVAVVEDMAASGGYMVAMACDRIFAESMSITGSIGVLAQFGEMTDLATKLGIKILSVKSTPLKGAPSPFEKYSKEAEEAITYIIKDLYNTFIFMLKERRPNIADSNMEFIVSGRIFTGKQALTLGLIDQIGSKKNAKEWLYSTHKDLDSLPVKKHHFAEPKHKLLDYFKHLQTMVGKKVESPLSFMAK